jgi:glycosyltransferase involved in cell wall biosynthesis
MIGAMACGTPTIGWRRGPVPEVIADGVTGFIVDRLTRRFALVRDCVQVYRAFC